jgi:glutaredoxin
MKLTLYTRVGCSLCENMQVELEPYRVKLRFELDIVDIDADSRLIDQYGTRVPVLEAGGRPLCEYFLDPEALERYFTGH